MKTFTEKKIKEYAIKLRKIHAEIEKKQFYCNEHNFKMEEKALFYEAERVRKIIHETENFFDLGFVWDNSLNEQNKK